MFRERLLWASTTRRYLAIDASKRVDILGTNFPVPIEVHPTAVSVLEQSLAQTSCTRYDMRVAGGKDGPVITESGFLIVDAWYDEIPHGLDLELSRIPGVLCTGLFDCFDFISIDSA